MDSNLFVVGVDDPEALDDRSPEEAEQTALEDIPDSAITILFKHRPHISALVNCRQI